MQNSKVIEFYTGARINFGFPVQGETLYAK